MHPYLRCRTPETSHTQDVEIREWRNDAFEQEGENGGRGTTE